MAGRHLSVDHTTVWRWVQRYAPVLNRRFAAGTEAHGRVLASE
jgi:transposase-like protein